MLILTEEETVGMNKGERLRREEFMADRSVRQRIEEIREHTDPAHNQRDDLILDRERLRDNVEEDRVEVGDRRNDRAGNDQGTSTTSSSSTSSGNRPRRERERAERERAERDEALAQREIAQTEVANLNFRNETLNNELRELRETLVELKEMGRVERNDAWAQQGDDQYEMENLKTQLKQREEKIDAEIRVRELAMKEGTLQRDLNTQAMVGMRRLTTERDYHTADAARKEVQINNLEKDLRESQERECMANSSKDRAKKNENKVKSEIAVKNEELLELLKSVDSHAMAHMETRGDLHDANTHLAIARTQLNELAAEYEEYRVQREQIAPAALVERMGPSSSNSSSSSSLEPFGDTPLVAELSPRVVEEGGELPAMGTQGVAQGDHVPENPLPGNVPEDNPQDLKAAVIH